MNAMKMLGYSVFKDLNNQIPCIVYLLQLHSLCDPSI